MAEWTPNAAFCVLVGTGCSFSGENAFFLDVFKSKLHWHLLNSRRCVQGIATM